MASLGCLKIQSQPIELAALLQSETSMEHGAQISFVGKVRAFNVGREVCGIEYEAFAPLAEQNFREFCEEARKVWGEDLGITILHRVGYLEVGAISVVILVSARHRGEAFEASRYIIEELKHRAPIWKKEFYVDGASEWVKGHALCQHHSQTLPSWRESVHKQTVARQ